MSQCPRLPSSALSITLVCILAIGTSLSVQAQRTVEFTGGNPSPPQGLAGKALPEGPFHYPTAEGMDIRVSVLARDIVYPSSMTFLPDGRLLVATREGLIRLIENDRLAPEPVSGGPEAYFSGDSGLPGAVHGYMDIALHPDFENSPWVYISYTKPVGDSIVLAVGRGMWTGSELADFSDVWSEPGTRGPGRIAFDLDGMLYITVSGSDSQDLATPGGKVLRLNPDGSIPSDNPFADQADAHPAVYTWGHRSGLGLAVHPVRNEIWLTENGPNGGDEINVLVPGANYGWPIVSLGRTYQGPWQSERPSHDRFEAPVVYWMPAIAVAGITFYQDDALPAWKGDVFVTALRTGQIPGTGHIERILLNEDMEELRRETLLMDLGQRMRDIRVGPDGLLYVATDEREGAILRIEAAQ